MSVEAPRPARLVIAAILVLLGLTVCGGWYFHVGWLKAILPGLSTMKMNTAMCFVAGGLSVALFALRRPAARALAAVLISMMGLVALLTLIEYEFGVSFGIDEWLIQDFDPPMHPFHGRMSFVTAAGFLTSAVSLGLLDAGRSGRAVLLAHLLGALTVVTAMLALSGYIFGAQGLYAFSPYLSMALHTGVGLLLLAAAILLTRPDEGWAAQFSGRPIATAAFLRIALISIFIPYFAGLLAVMGIRRGWYQAAFSPTLFAVATAFGLVLVAFRSARILASAEDDVRVAREASRISEQRLGLALSIGRGIGSWELDMVRQQVMADERFARLYGIEPALARAGAPLSEFFRAIHPGDLPRVQGAIEEALRTKKPFSQEYRLVTQERGEAWVLAEGRCEYSADGAPLRFPGVSFDISDRKLVEVHQAALLRLSDRLRDMSDVEQVAFEASKILGETLRISRVGYGIVDKEAETITIERDWNAPGVRSLAGVLQFRDYGSYIDNLKRGETVVFADAKLDPRTRNNAEALIAISARSIVNMPLVEQGGFVALLYANNAAVRSWREPDLMLMRQVADRVRLATERLRAERATRNSEEQFRVFAQTVPSQIWAARPDGHLDWFNEQVHAYSGKTWDELQGTDSWARIVHPDDFPIATAAWSRSLASGTGYETEFRMRRADGVYRWFLSRAEPVKSPDGAVVRWVGTNTDIDDSRLHSEQLVLLNSSLEMEVDKRTRSLMAAEEQLRQSQKMEAVGQLTGGLAHDFNNLLTGITGSLELLSARIAQGRIGEIERFVLAAQGAARRAAALTHRLLAFSRRQTLDPKATDANRLIGSMEDLIRRTVGPAIELNVITAGGLWPTLVDPNQLENALLNLCINARDAMPDGGRVTIETGNKWLDEQAARQRQLPPGQYISVCVTDTGTGMTPEIIAKAFDPFFTTKPMGEGTGLGLSMVYGFVRQSGGEVHIYSEHGQGTMVCLYLPRHRGETDAVEVPAEMTATHRALSGETVLVVDDEPTVRMLVTEVLEDLGYAAIEANDASAGLKILESNVRIDLLVTDVGLPGGINGRQMADAGRVHRKHLKVLFITGYAENAVVANGHLEHGMHVMTKPFTLEAIATKIRQLIDTPWQ